MPLIEYTLDGKHDKVKTAIKRLQSYDPIKNGFSDKPYYGAYSGGKDSDVIRILLELSGCKHELVHNHTTVDAPETVHYVRSVSNIQINYPEMLMWRLIVKKRMPPTRIARYCCEYLKERNGADRFVVTGVRWDESIKRKKNRSSLEVQASKSANKLMLNSDNDEHRRQFETCTLKGKRINNPIIDWADADVWEFLNHYGCKSNPLYQCGYTRVGCVGCPMAGEKGTLSEFEQYPKYKEIYIRAFGRMVTARLESGLPTAWENGEDVFNWWVHRKNQDKNIEGQISLL